MTTLRTAAQQALEALKIMQPEVQMGEGDAAIKALKAALAEPVQEPVAWSFEARHIDTAFGPAVSIRHPGREHKYMRNVKPLYLAPPQRKPLTEEEIDSIWDSEKVFPDIYAIARAIERAHGIGGNDE